MPKVSVILTTHHGRKDVCLQAIDSVLNQTYDDFELIVVDDASHDGTAKAVKSIKDPRLIYIKRDKNYGSDTKPKNEGILASTGEFLAFLDSDNQYRKDHLAVLVNQLENNPKIALVYGQRMVIDGEKKNVGTTGEFDPARLMVQNYIDTSDVLVRREAIFDVGGFDQEQSKYIDWNLWVRLVKAGYDFLLVPMVLTDYYIRDDGKSKTKVTKREQEYIEKTGKFVNLPDWNPIDCLIQLPYLGEIRKPKVAIFTLTHDRLEYSQKCFAAMKETAGYPYDHFIVDNGSEDGTREYLDEVSGNVRCVTFNEKNLGISRASNQALDAIGNEYDIIMKVDNDCLFLNKGWLKAMIEVWKRNRRIALSCYIQGLKDNPGGAPRLVYGEIGTELIGMTRHLGGICHFVDAKAYQDFRWDEESFLHGMQDLEFSKYLLANGYQMGYLENWYAEHMDGTVGQHKKYPEYFERRKIEKTTKL